jgi:hypothetical protein
VAASMLDTVASCPSIPRKLINLPAPAAVPSQAEYFRNMNDRRTNVRLRYFRDLGFSLALDRGWDVVDFFELTMPLVWETRDGVHYLMTDAIDPLLDEIIGKAALCEEE